MFKFHVVLCSVAAYAAGISFHPSLAEASSVKRYLQGVREYCPIGYTAENAGMHTFATRQPDWLQQFATNPVQTYTRKMGFWCFRYQSVEPPKPTSFCPSWQKRIELCGEGRYGDCNSLFAAQKKQCEDEQSELDDPVDYEAELESLLAEVERDLERMSGMDINSLMEHARRPWTAQDYANFEALQRQ